MRLPSTEELKLCHVLSVGQHASSGEQRHDEGGTSEYWARALASKMMQSNGIFI
jgi:hypothetical protein